MRKRSHGMRRQPLHPHHRQSQPQIPSWEIWSWASFTLRTATGSIASPSRTVSASPPSPRPNLTASNPAVSVRRLHRASLNMKKLFQLLNQMVQDTELSNYAIGGAIGAVFYVEPFVTHDVDVFVVMQTESTGLVTNIPGWDYLKERGYAEIRGEAIIVEDWPVQFIP